MKNSNLKIEASPDKLKVRIEKDLNFNLFHFFMIGILAIGHIVVILFILNSIRNEGLIGMKVLFVIFGLWILLIANKQLREILIFIKGFEEIEVDEDSFQYKGVLGPIHKHLNFKLDKIRKFDLITSETTDPFAQSTKLFTQMKYGMIRTVKSRKDSVSFGQSLKREDLITLYNELEKKIQLPTRRSH